MINSKNEDGNLFNSNSPRLSICTKTSELDEKYKFDRKLTDARFGNIMLLQDPNTGQYVCYKERILSDKSEVERLASAAEIILQQRHQYVSGLIDYAVAKSAELWSNRYTMRLYYEYTRWSLKDEIRKRFKLGDKFGGEELTHLLYQQIDANMFLKERVALPAILTPQRIAFNKERMETKLVYDAMDKPSRDVVREQHKRLIAGHNIYVSPLLFDSLKKEQLDITVNIEKEVIFALGLIILECGVSRPIQDIYNNQSKRFLKIGLKGHLKAFKARLWEYPSLCAAVRSMLSVNEEKRFNFEQLRDSIPSYGEIKRLMEEGNDEEDEGELEHNIWETRHTSSEIDCAGRETQLVANIRNNAGMVHDIVDGKSNYTNLLSMVNKQIREDNDKNDKSQLATSKCFSAIKVNSSVITPKKEVTKHTRIFKSDAKSDQHRILTPPVALFKNGNGLDEYGYNKQEQRKKISDYPTNIYYCNMFSNENKRPTELHQLMQQSKDENARKYGSAQNLKMIPQRSNTLAPAPFKIPMEKQAEQHRASSSKPCITRSVPQPKLEPAKSINTNNSEMKILTHNINKNNVKYVNSVAIENSHPHNSMMCTSKPSLSYTQKGLLASLHRDVFKPDGNIRHIHLKENSIVEPKVVRSYSAQSLVRSAYVPPMPLAPPLGLSVQRSHNMSATHKLDNINHNDIQQFIHQDFKSYSGQHGPRTTNTTSRSVSVNTTYGNGIDTKRNTDNSRDEIGELCRGVRVIERGNGVRTVDARINFSGGYGGVTNFSEYG